MSDSPFSKLGLHADLVQGVTAMGFTAPTPIQAAAVPPAVEGRDVLGCAQTGGGKTAAFALPVLNRLTATPRPGLRALVLVPSRELAAQVETSFRDCGRFAPHKVALVIGGVGYFGQRQALSGGAQIAVATPGRLQDHIRQGSARLDRIEVLVLDEADRMLDMGFLPAIKEIVAKLPKQRQTLLFSATLGPDIEKIAAFTLRNPVRVEISKPTTVAAGITQVVYPVPQDRKTDLLAALLSAAGLRSGLVFTRTKHGADRLAKRMAARGFSVGVLHSGRTQGQRAAAMEDFRSGKTQVLIATDVAARGIDVREISHVVNFDVPRHPEDYVHRVGRTARAHGVGDAMTLMSPDEAPFLRDIEKFTGVVFPRAVLPGFPAAPQSSPRPQTPPGAKKEHHGGAPKGFHGHKGYSGRAGRR
ncbi:MAG: DEAD/DEAH box helicase [Elusimicrobia bacterium]|nr:DEAD/DEAH box helicase [Elusimicrobiota bacterium]